MSIFGFLRSDKNKKEENTPLDKMRQQVDAMPDMMDVSEFRLATAKAIAAHNEMKLDAQENPNPELFEELLPFSEFFLKKMIASAFEAAQNKGTFIDVSIMCSDEEYGIRPNSFYYLEDRFSVSITIRSVLRDGEIEYSFDDEISQWTYYYMLVDWIREQLASKNLTVLPSTRYTRDPNGWNAAKDNLIFLVQWGDDVFVDAVKKFTDQSQVEAYMAGVPIEDIVA